MTEQSEHGREEATEAAENVAERVESWEYSAEEDTVREKLDEGLAEAGVDVPQDEREKLVDQIKDAESSPQVDDARPDGSI